ncbi:MULTISPECIES: tRNA (adenosine(37)-N6)-dimethylallyltransferase MiaA [Cyanophyceae]|uniref:tRNA (adenosine(37)-N6)-dimethylallyltransferase MiaA n=1 Tax=Cyanophyceae TaxID=3028117 RepID=UPI001682F72E|nr:MULTISPECIES: tRNA (adenosine(37)-N6)-dimethylallyltransferase MiaA [Cyanophyceae]MBD1918403.1 tRNA (adenosine(37)-N6)-dimethylallyltransferase MiaA [Phormidium sp. FACHB-77]MBD2028728.1 tRNA (adenosine(37)-N6)-dimethylallyltransferase MiaA [Phormidium sp. FACHB-322]MBD2051149.1 tRNA (adenosine(37)-N6)-dimethylallyltransferase MiaA [Leptolyngbya sp. FACHB-60]
MQSPKFSRLESSLQETAGYSSSVPFLWVIGGATATGKSSLAIALAQRLQGCILSADSRQIYREFDIGTAKPSTFDRQQIPHYLIDICDPTETLTLAQYQRQAQDLIHTFHQADAVPMLVGGTGLYIDAVVKGLRIPPVAPQPALRQQLEVLGQFHCYALLKSLDAAAAQRIHPNDPVRTVRALEVFYVTGQPMSLLQGEAPPAYPVLYLALDCDALALERRIAQRTQAMIEAGFVDEVTHLLKKYGPKLPLLQTLGYAEMLRYVQGDVSLAVAQADIVQHTRQFAKRQRTWFRNRATAQWFDADAKDLVEQVWDWFKERRDIANVH